MLYLTEEEVRRLLPMRECIGLMRTVFERLAAGEAINQPRRRLILPTRSTLHYMAASDGRYFGAKIYATNPARGAHFLFLLYRAADAEPLAILEANYLGQIRTGAASGLATDLLARAEARTVGIIGSGFQARTQLDAMALVRPVKAVKVWSRSAEKRATFAEECAARLAIPVAVAASAEEAAQGADILITATNSKEPVVRAEWVTDGTHINAMGSNQAARRELPGELIRQAELIVVDSLEQSRMEAGDLIREFQESDWNRAVELQDVAAGRQGRRNPAEITIFESLGIAAEDVAAAAFVYERAIAGGVGRATYS